MSVSTKRLLQHTLLAAALGGVGVTAAFAQTSNVTLYGSLDQYLNHMRSSSGLHGTHLEDGSTMRSRFGLRGQEDLGNGLSVKFQLEGGLNIDRGAGADSTRLFDRQAWVGLANNDFGELRFGRQNGSIFAIGSYIDYTGRTLGSVVNAFGAPARYDNTIGYLSPRINGLHVNAYYSMTPVANSSRQAVYQLGVDYLNGPVRVGYAGLMARPPSAAVQKKKVRYDNLYANYDYGQGKIYLTWLRSNNITAAGDGTNNGGSILSNVGGLVAGADANVNIHHNVWQISADYRIEDNLRVGALFGQIKESGSDNKAVGGAVGLYYDLSKRTTFLAGIQRLNNRRNAGFRPSGSAGLSNNFSGADVNGRNITGYHAGMVHRF